MASQMEAALNLLTSEREPSRVAYRFDISDDPQAQWLVTSAEISESLSSRYAVQIALVSEDGDNPDKLLGKACTLTLERDTVKRTIHGIVTRTRAPVTANSTSVNVSATLVPALEALAHRVDTRIFQDKSVPEVLDLVLRAGLAPYGRKHEPKRLRRGDYPKREYIVQYRETDLAFVQRLMAEEGIWYCFEHGDDAAEGELLVLLDDNNVAVEAKLGDDGAELPLQLGHQGVTYWQAVTEFTEEKRLAPTSLTAFRYDWTRPAVLEAKSPPDADPGVRPLYEHYDVTSWEYSREDKRYRKSDIEDQARMRWEQVQGQAAHARGTSNVIGL